MSKYIRVILLLILFSKNSFASHEKVILVTEHLPPYQIVNADNSKVTGFATDIILETLKRADLDYDLNAYPWVRTYNLALKKPNHCIFSVAISMRWFNTKNRKYSRLVYKWSRYKKQT